jgi:prepilin-type N-terminal cleavage/methylation domain-containing protein
MQHRAPSRQQGLTVIEVLVALVLVTVGLLGFAGTSALAVRSAATAVRQHDALVRAGRRMALLAATGCDRALSGETARDGAGVRERCVVGPPRNGAATLAMTVEWVDPRGARALTLQSALLC